MKRLQWIFELQDRISGPAAKASASVDKVTRSMSAASAASTRVASAVNAASAAPARMAPRMARLATVTQQVAPPARAAGTSVLAMASRFAASERGVSMMNATLAGLRSALSSLAIGAAAAGIGAIAAAAGVASRALTAMMDRGRELRTLRVLTGDVGEALRMRGRFRDMADFLGMSPGDVSRGMTELLTKGFSETDATRIFQGTADIAAISPTADTSRIILAMSQIRQAGVLQGDELNQLAESGLPLQHVYERIAQAMGYTGENAAAFVRAQRGTIPSAIALQGIMDGIADTTGTDLGGVAREASLGFAGQWERLKTLPERFFAAFADESSVLGQRMTGILARVNELLSPDGEGSSRMIDLLSGALDWVSGALESAIPMAERFFTWLRDPTTTVQMQLLWHQAQETLGGIWSLVSGMIGIVQTIAPTVSTMADMVAGGLYQVGATVDIMLVQPFQRVRAIFSGIGAFFSGIVAKFNQFGTDIIMGLVRGMQAVASLPAQTIANAGQGVIESLATMLGIRSPSRVMMAMGEDTAEGFALGIDGGRQAYIAPPDVGLGMGVGAGGILGAGAGAGVSQSITIGDIIVTAGSGDAGDIASQVRAAIRAELAGAFDAMAMEAAT